MNTPLEPRQPFEPVEPTEPREPRSASWFLLFSLLFAGGILVWLNADYLRREWNLPSPQKPTPLSKFDTKLARARALEKFPDLAKEDSPLRQTFEALEIRARRDRPEIFTNPDWPMLLAAEAAKKVY